MIARALKSAVVVSSLLLALASADVALAEQQAASPDKQQQQESQSRAVARTFAELGTRLQPGDTVIVTREAGERTEAKVQGFDNDLQTLFLSAGSGSFGMTEPEIQQLALREQDSLVNGAVIGASVGGGIFVIAGIACALVSDCNAASETFAAAAVFGGIGAGVGVGIDAMVKTERLVYVGPAGGAFSVALAPVASREGRGVRVVFRF